MTGIADAHYALVLREVARFARIWRARLNAPGAGSSTFQLSELRPTDPTLSYLRHFERSTGDGHAEWQSPSFSKSPDLPRCLKTERGVVRTLRLYRWKWHELALREEAQMWAGLVRLRVARERWWESAWGELLLIEAPGQSFGDPPRVAEQAFAVQEFLRVFASLTTEVTIANALAEAEHKKQPRVLTANDEWALVRSCDLTVKVLGEIPVAPWRSTSWREEVAAED